MGYDKMTFFLRHRSSSVLLFIEFRSALHSWLHVILQVYIKIIISYKAVLTLSPTTVMM